MLFPQNRRKTKTKGIFFEIIHTSKVHYLDLIFNL